VDLRRYIREIPDFPRPGIGFKDVTPLLADAQALDTAVGELAGRVADREVDMVVGVEARGFLLGPALARQLGAGFIPARKPGNLPCTTIEASYDLEYGTDTLQVHSDALAPGARVVVHDDLLATGGTASAVCDLVEQLEGEVVACVFLVELAFLDGRARLPGRDVRSLVVYEAE
jgi:adenine phosphoribosyltransferase